MRRLCTYLFMIGLGALLWTAPVSAQLDPGRRFARIKDLSESEGISVLLAEQNAVQALTVADFGYVLETGRVVLEGATTDLLEDGTLWAAYLGA